MIKRWFGLAWFVLRQSLNIWLLYTVWHATRWQVALALTIVVADGEYSNLRIIAVMAAASRLILKHERNNGGHTVQPTGNRTVPGVWPTHQA